MASNPINPIIPESIDLNEAPDNGHVAEPASQFRQVRRYWARLVAAAPMAIVLLMCEASYAGQGTIEWTDSGFCSHKIRFDPRKYDATRIRNTADFIFSGYLHASPVPQAYLKPGDSGVNEFRDACARYRQRLQSFDLVDLPGMEAYRHLLLEQSEDWCEFGTVLIRGTFGDIAALRSFKASAIACSRYLDALEGKIDLKQVWRELVTSECKNIYKPEACRAAFLAAEGQPDETERIKRDVLEYGWQNCSTRYVKTGNSLRQEADSRRRELDAKFSALIRMTRSCR
jgi:hypothetical protein